MPSCYMVTTMEITDEEKFANYVAAAGPTMRGHEFEILVNDASPSDPGGQMEGSRTVRLKRCDLSQTKRRRRP